MHRTLIGIEYLGRLLSNASSMHSCAIPLCFLYSKTVYSSLVIHPGEKARVGNESDGIMYDPSFVEIVPCALNNKILL
jgi:hypothetical protein